MKKIILALLILQTFTGNAQSRSNVFLAAEISETFGVSLAYNYAIQHKLGVGLAIEVLNTGPSDGGDVSAVADFRYYFVSGKFSIIPIIQVGKYLYDYEATIFGDEILVKGGVHIATGLGFSYKLFGKKGGIFSAIKYRSVSVNSTFNGSKTTDSDGNLVFSIGFRI